MEKCRLCLCDAELQRSHIIPRTVLKSAKSGQRWTFEHEKDEPYLRNTDLMEKLLCSACENQLSKLEGSQIGFLRNGKIVKKTGAQLRFPGFNFSKFYLFLISILWRASIAKGEAFAAVDLGEDLNEALRRIIYAGELKTLGGDFSEILQIGVIRLTGGGKLFPEKELRAFVSSIFEWPVDEGKLYYIIFCGFLFNFYISYDVRTQFPEYMGRIQRTLFLKVPIIGISNSAQADSVFCAIAEKMAKHCGVVLPTPPASAL